MSLKCKIERPLDGLLFAVLNTKPSVTFRFALEWRAILLISFAIVNLLRQIHLSVISSPDRKSFACRVEHDLFPSLHGSSCSVPNLTLIIIIESYFKSCRVFPLCEKSDPDRRQV
jgi:hypothetical protein